MAKLLCKLNRREITDNLDTIYSLVREPQFLCRSCARSSAEKSYLCKPEVIPVSPLANAHSYSPQTDGFSRGDTSMKKSQPGENSVKKLKKAAKKQKKLTKKLNKVVKKQQKLARRHEKLEQKLAKLNQTTVV